jgi:hypothetical protein
MDKVKEVEIKNGGGTPGKEAALLRPTPLRTVRATFVAYGSSLSKIK